MPTMRMGAGKAVPVPAPGTDGVPGAELPVHEQPFTAAPIPVVSPPPPPPPSDAGTTRRQAFTRNGGYWMFELVPGERFSYGNPDGEEWLMSFDFDLSHPVAPLPAPWGYEDTQAHAPPPDPVREDPWA